MALRPQAQRRRSAAQPVRKGGLGRAQRGGGSTGCDVRSSALQSIRRRWWMTGRRGKDAHVDVMIAMSEKQKMQVPVRKSRQRMITRRDGRRNVASNAATGKPTATAANRKR